MRTSLVGYALHFTPGNSIWIDRWRQLVGIENEDDGSVTWNTPGGAIVERRTTWTIGMEAELARVVARVRRALEAVADGEKVASIWS